MTRTPMKRRPAKRKGRDPEYLAFIHLSACAVPGFEHSRFDVEAHHAGDHGLGQRAPDRTCIPLCAWHHRIGPESVHVLGKRFWAHHGLDLDALVAEYNRRYEEEKA